MTANIIVHGTKPWIEIPHYWQVRLVADPSIDYDVELRFAFDDRFPHLALIATQDALETENLEHAFCVSPELMKDLSLHVFRDLPSDMTDNQILELASGVLGISAT